MSRRSLSSLPVELPTLGKDALDRHDGYADALEGEKFDWSITVRFPGSMRSLITHIVNHQRLGFQSNPSLLMRWAMYEGIRELGKFLEKEGDGTIATYMRHDLIKRKRAIELRRRMDFLDDLSAFESAFHIYMQAGEVEALAADLHQMYEYVESIEDKFWHSHLAKAALNQPLVQQALEYLAHTHQDPEIVNQISAWGAL